MMRFTLGLLVPLLLLQQHSSAAGPLCGIDIKGSGLQSALQKISDTETKSGITFQMTPSQFLGYDAIQNPELSRECKYQVLKFPGFSVIKLSARFESNGDSRSWSFEIPIKEDRVKEGKPLIGNHDFPPLKIEVGDYDVSASYSRDGSEMSARIATENLLTGALSFEGTAVFEGRTFKIRCEAALN